MGVLPRVLPQRLAHNQEHGRSPPNGYGLWDDPGADRFHSRWSGGDTRTFGPVLSADAWLHVASTLDVSSAEVNLFVGGDVEETLTNVGLPLAAAGELRLGAICCTAEQLRARVDEVRISAVARSPEWLAFQHRGASNTLLSIGLRQDRP